MRISRRNFLLAAAAKIWPQEPKFTAGVDVVTVFATVRDREGAVVTNLDRAIFLLQEDGVPQTIRYFSRESDLPLTSGVLVDTARARRTFWNRSAARVTRFSTRSCARAPARHSSLTSMSTWKCSKASRHRGGAGSGPGAIKVPDALATLLYNAIRECSENQMKRKEGRKAFVLLSDGVDYRSKSSLGTAIEYAQRADTIVYSILFAEPLRAYGRFVPLFLRRTMTGAER